MSSKPVDTAIIMVVGPCIDDTDFKSLEESIAYNAAGMDISLIVEKTDGTSTVTAITLTTGGTSDWTHKDGGYYEVEITAAQNTEEGIAYLRGVCTGVLPFESVARYDIVKANIYDSLVKGTDKLQVDVTQLLGTAWLTPGVAGTPDVNAKLIGATAQTGRDIGASVLLSAGTGAGQLDFTSGIVKSNLTQILAHLLTQTGTQLADGFEHFFDVATPTGTLDSLPAAAPNAAGGLPISAAGGLDLDAVLSGNTPQTGDSFARIGAAGASLTDLGGMSTGMKAEVESEANDALIAVHLDHLLAADYDPASKPGVATALLNELIENDGGVSRYTANALEQAPSGGTNPNVLIDTTISGAPSSQTVFVLAAGSDIDDAYNDQAIVLYDASNNDYPSVRKVSDYTGATKTVTLDSAPDFTIIAGDGVKTFVTAPGTTAPTVGQIRAEMEGVGYFLDLIKADTNELQTDWVNGGRLDLILDIIAADTTTDIPAILNHADYGLAKLVRSTTPANALDVSVTGEAGLDFANIKDAVGAHTLTNITVPTTTTVTNEVTADAVKISGDATAANNVEATYDGTGYTDDSAPATQEQVGRLTSGSAAINTIAESFTKSGAEPETNTYTSTAALDGVYHIVEDAAGATDCYYQFDVGGNGVPVSITWQGYANSQGDSYSIWAYNYGTTSYEQIGTVSGVNGTTLVENTFALTNAHVGTGANLGKVRLRFLSADGTAFATDRLLCAYAIVTKSVGYADGAIWINTSGSNTNTEAYVDGTADNPVSTWAAAKTLSTSLGIEKFHLTNGSSIILDSNSDNFTFVGCEYALALGGQSLENAHIENANVTGTATAGTEEIHFKKCYIGTSTIGKSSIIECGMYGTITVSAAETYIFDRCYNAADGSVPPVIDFGGAVGNTHCAFRNWQGGVEVANLGAAGTDVFSVTGKGKVVIASTCAAGTIKIVGHFTITDNVVGGFSGTLSDDSRYDVDQINAECDTALTDYDAPTNTEMIAAFTEIKGATWAAGTDTLEHIRNKQTDIEADTAAILLDTGTDGVLLAATATSAQLVDDVWDEILSGVTHNIANSAGRRIREIGAYAIESGTAQAGNSHSITLAATASAIDGTYNRNLIVLVDNTGAGQTRTIVDYDGATKIAIIDRDWRTSPDATTTYQVTPDNTPLVVDQGIAQAGTSTTITLRAYASSSNDIYLCNVVAIIAGTGRGQARLVGTYNGTTKVMTICGDNWVTNPDNTSVYVLMPYGTTCTSCMGTYALGQINTEVKDCLTIDTIADSYATDGNQPTIAQGILAIQQMLQEKSISGTTLTVKKPDGSTVAMTFTLDSATAPTSITRAT